MGGVPVVTAATASAGALAAHWQTSVQKHVHTNHQSPMHVMAHRFHDKPKHTTTCSTNDKTNQEACTANFHTAQQRKEPRFASSLLEFDSVLGEGVINAGTADIGNVMGLNTTTRLNVYVSSSSSLVLMNADKHPGAHRGGGGGASVETRPVTVSRRALKGISR
ncbi:hypothetical protein F5888DRAFT_1636250 [Russula emetica]|nr:hypothetical protein F5888DRAFT_1636250 [Russula emetica]